MKFNLKGVTPATWVRIVALILVLANQISVSIFNFQLLPFTDEEIYEVVSTVVTVIVTVTTGWYNNSLTENAQEADKTFKGAEK